MSRRSSYTVEFGERRRKEAGRAVEDELSVVSDLQPLLKSRVVVSLLLATLSRPFSVALLVAQSEADPGARR